MADRRAVAIFLDAGRGGVMAHALGPFLGANRTARTRCRALAKMGADLREYAAFLRRHGEPVPPPGRLRVVEVVGGQDPWIAGGTNALFAPERAPATDADVARTVRRMAWLRAETLSIVRGLTARERAARPAGAPRSVDDTLRHVASAELWYLTRIGADVSDRGIPEDPFARLRACRRAVRAALGSLTPPQRSGVFVPRRFCSARQLRTREPWTARKVLRRLLEHERQHARHLRRLVGMIRP